MISFMFRCFSCVLLLLASLTAPALAEKGKLRERLTPAVMAIVYPGAERLGLEEGRRPRLRSTRATRSSHTCFQPLDIVAAVGYSATPFDVIGGVDLNGRITGAKVIAHNEPYT
jgi:transcriptional regulator of nitric oxide reductase